MNLGLKFEEMAFRDIAFTHNYGVLKGKRIRELGLPIRDNILFGRTLSTDKQA